MESYSILFNKPFLMVAILVKYFACVTSFIIQSVWCNLTKVQQAIIREIL